MKEIKDVTNRRIFLNWKNQYCKNDYTTKYNVYIQCGPYQITNSIFHRTRTNNFTIHMETQKTPKNGAGGIKLPDFGYTTKIQSSRQYDTGTKTET